MTDNVPYSNYQLTVRLKLMNKPGIFATVAALEEAHEKRVIELLKKLGRCPRGF